VFYFFDTIKKYLIVAHDKNGRDSWNSNNDKSTLLVFSKRT